MLLVLIVACLATGASDDASRIAVVDLSTPGIEAERGRALSANLVSILAAEVSALGFRVISSADINAMLSLEKQKDLVGCQDNTSCLSEIGGALGVNDLISGQVGRLGDTFTLTLTLVDTVRAEVRQRFQAEAGSEAVLGDVARRGVHVLFGRGEAQSGFGMMVVRTDPEGGRVFLDGKDVGHAPVTLDQVRAGDHELRAEGQGRKGSAKVRLASNAVERITIALRAGERLKARFISTPPDVSVYVDDRLVGVTPVLVEDLESGEHRVRFAAAGLRPVERVVTFGVADAEKSGGSLKVEAALERELRLLPIRVGVALGAVADGRTLGEGAAFEVEALVAPWAWLEMGLGYGSPTAFTFAPRFFIVQQPVQLGLLLHAALFREPIAGDFEPALAAGVTFGVDFDAYAGRLGLRLEAMLNRDTRPSPGVGGFTFPVSAAVVWRI